MTGGLNGCRARSREFPPSRPLLHPLLPDLPMRAGRNLIRSIVFWAGLLVILFLVWAAVYSRYRSVNWSYIVGTNHSISITSSGQCLRVKDTRISGGSFTSAANRGSVMIAPLQPTSGTWFPAVDFGREFRPAPVPKLAARGVGTGITFLAVPYWLILVVIIPPWLLLSMWRARRIGRIHSAAGDGPVRTAA